VLADAPRPGQLGFQDPATEGFFSMGHLHHAIWMWLSLVLVLVFTFLALVIFCFWLQQAIFGLFLKERLSLTEDTELEFG
jgi:hypothetical protein